MTDAEQPTIAQLMKEIHAAFDEALSQRDEARRQRDEARREVCNWSVGVGLKATSQAVAEERGWDCFKETP